MHRLDYQYTITGKVYGHDWTATMFTYPRICNAYPHKGNAAFCTGNLVLHISRSEAAFQLRAMRNTPELTIRRTVDTIVPNVPTSIEFHETYCKKVAS